MVWLADDEAKKPPVDEGSVVMKLMAGGGYTFRLVNSYNELIEKIRIFDDGQDDRVLEALKLGFIVEQQAPASQKVFYDGIAEKEGRKRGVRLVVVKREGKTVHEVPFDELRRQAAVVSRASTAEGERGKWLCVDQTYAAELQKGAGQ